MQPIPAMRPVFRIAPGVLEPTCINSPVSTWRGERGGLAAARISSCFCGGALQTLPWKPGGIDVRNGISGSLRIRNSAPSPVWRS